MNAEEFVANWKLEKASLFRTFIGESGQSLVANKIASMGLSDEQKDQLHSLLNEVLTDTMYTLLLGLDGSTTIGRVQHNYKIFGEDEKLISAGSDLEAEAWKQFHGNV